MAQAMADKSTQSLSWMYSKHSSPLTHTVCSVWLTKTCTLVPIGTLCTAGHTSKHALVCSLSGDMKMTMTRSMNIMMKKMTKKKNNCKLQRPQKLLKHWLKLCAMAVTSPKTLKLFSWSYLHRLRVLVAKQRRRLYLQPKKSPQVIQSHGKEEHAT